MLELYKMFSIFENARILTLFIISLCFLGWFYWIWQAGKEAGSEITRSQWIQFYVSGLCLFLSTSMSFGLIFAPQNTESLIQLLQVKPIVTSLSENIQKVVLGLIRFVL